MRRTPRVLFFRNRQDPPSWPNSRMPLLWSAFAAADRPFSTHAQRRTHCACAGRYGGCLMHRLVAIDLANGRLFVDVLQMIWDRGDAALPIDQRLPASARNSLLAELRPSSVIDDAGEHGLADGFGVEPGDAVVLSTSGSSGVPKGVVLTHDAIGSSARITNERLAVNSGKDKWYACLPFAHIGGLSVVMRSLLGGVAFTPTAATDETSFREAARSGHTMISLVPAALERIEAAAWRTVLLGGSAMPELLPPNAVRTYGMTETGSGVVYDGSPLRSVSVRVVDGEIQLRSPTLARGYRNSMGFVALPMSDDGWFLTADAGEVDTNARLTVTGRVGDMIVTGGEKVWPEPVERVLQSVPAVRDVAVCGVADPTWGHAVVALIVATDADSPPAVESLRHWVKQTLPAYCAPQRIVVVDEIPRTAIGKIRRRDVQTIAAAAFDS